MNAVERLFRRTADGIQPSLEVMEALVQTLDHPERSFALVHVAGTNGKGSVCAMIESVLRASGLKTGLYTSPHLISFQERFRINGVSISDKKLNRYILALEAHSDAACEELSLRRATFFELSTLIAFQFFADEQVDVAIIETGMGGRWDATNVVYPLCSVITKIGIDHTDFLGDTLEAIAGEKAGIIKSGRPVISAPQESDVRTVLDAVGEPIRYSDESVGVRFMAAPQRLKVESQERSLPAFELPLLGAAQRENVAVAVTALEVLSEILSIELAFVEGLEQVRWPGRLMEVSSHPSIWLDGSHNPQGGAVLAENLKACFPDRNISFIVGFLEDKDVVGYVRTWHKMAHRVWAVPLPCLRGLSAEETAQRVYMGGVHAEACSLQGAWQAAAVWAKAEADRMVVVCGSLYLMEACVEEGLLHADLFKFT
ncbi:MAG: bifunctional folylpolyglutamate synthase/dihydrofolate synthase [Pontiellaceae bacterium]